MMKNMNRRRVRKRPRKVQKTKMKFVPVLAIMVLAIALGYGTARFVIGPLLGYDTDESSINIVSKDEPSSNDGYALQFGVFSTKEGALKLVESLMAKGIEAEIVEEDDQYKVISPIIKTKDEALDKLNDIKDKNVEDVFIASF